MARTINKMEKFSHLLRHVPSEITHSKIYSIGRNTLHKIYDILNLWRGVYLGQRAKQ